MQGDPRWQKNLFLGKVNLSGTVIKGTTTVCMDCLDMPTGIVREKVLRRSLWVLQD